jgi:small acid-soluble spore protein H (minor)
LKDKVLGDDDKMDVERARQIIESDGVIEVLYQGSPVWIEKILDNNQAQVSDIKTNKVNEVPLYMLVEKNLH